MKNVLFKDKRKMSSKGYIFCNDDYIGIMSNSQHFKIMSLGQAKIIITKWSENVQRILLYCKLFLERPPCSTLHFTLADEVSPTKLNWHHVGQWV